jgi:hypothetical protein
MTSAAKQPRLRVYFEPFVNSDEWWIAHFEIHNPSDHLLRIDAIRVLTPWRARISLFFGGYAGGSSNGGPMEYDLPEEVSKMGTAREVERMGEDEPPQEVSKTEKMQYLGELIVKIPRRSLRSQARFRVKVAELGTFPRQLSFKIAAPFPTKKNTPARY